MRSILCYRIFSYCGTAGCPFGTPRELAGAGREGVCHGARVSGSPMDGHRREEGGLTNGNSEGKAAFEEKAKLWSDNGQPDEVAFEVKRDRGLSDGKTYGDTDGNTDGFGEELGGAGKEDGENDRGGRGGDERGGCGEDGRRDYGEDGRGCPSGMRRGA